MATDALTSLSNPRVVAARKLRRRPQRDKAGRFLIEGCRVVLTALESGAPVIEVFIADEAPCEDMIGDLVERKDIRLTRVRPPVIKALSETATPQGVIAVVEQPPADLSRLPADASFVL